MNLDREELDDLAAFFGRRLDPRLDATPPPASPREEQQRTLAWQLVLEEAAESGKLSSLFARMKRRHPGDAQLQAALSLLEQPSRNTDRLLGALFVGVAAVGIFAVTFAGGLAGGAWYALPAASEVAALASIESPMQTVPIAPADTGGIVTPQRAEHSQPTGRCTAEDGGLVGYWYAGARPPGTAGEVVAIESSINVRQRFPAKDNGYDARSRIRCVLRPGDRVRLSESPLHVDGDRFWVPLTSGDLIPAPQSASNGEPHRSAG